MALTPMTPSSLVRPAAWAAGVLSALTVTSKSTRDALFCAFFPAEALPKAMLAGAALSALFALATARTFRRHGPASVLSPLLWINALAFLVEHAMVEAAPRAVALILYLHVSGVTGLILSGFWSVVNERFDPHALRLSISRIGLGGTLGGFVGGVTAERIAAWAGARHTLLELCVLSGLAALTLGRLRAPSSAAPAVAAVKARPLGSAYLRQIALFVALTALASSVIDFAFKARAMDRFTSPEELMQFFALFYTGVSLLSFLVQATVTPRLLDRLGLGAGLGGLPLALASAGVVALAWPGLVAQAVLRGADGALVGSLYRSSYEPLYTPIAPDDKRAAKAVIDVLVNRLGDGVGSLIVWGLVLLLPGAAALGANAVVALVAASALFVAVRLRQGYIDELARSLRSGAVVLDEWGVRDQTTRLTLSRTLSDLNRERLLAEIEIQHQRTLKEESEAAQRAGPSAENGHATGRNDPSTEPAVSDAPASSGAVGAGPVDSSQRVAALVEDLLSKNPTRLRRALEQAEASLAAFVIPLIARDDVGAQAMNKLSAFGNGIIGQLSDALVDAQRHSATVRRRLVRVIATTQSPWAAAALAAALEDSDFDVRRQAVCGLEEIAECGIDVPLTRAAALDVALRELLLSDGAVSGERSEHVLRLLGLVFDREAFRLARAALGNDDPKLRGTALEYLDNVLPTPVKTTLFSVLPPEPALRTTRVEQELIDELRRTLA